MMHCYLQSDKAETNTTVSTWYIKNEESLVSFCSSHGEGEVVECRKKEKNQPFDH